MAHALDGPTRREAETRLQIREQRKAAEAAVIAAWRRAHPDSPVSDATALILANLEAAYPQVTRSRRAVVRHCATCRCGA